MSADEMVSKWKLAAALALALFAFMMWFVFLRAVPLRTARGVITTKTAHAGHTYIQQPVGRRSGFWTPIQIPIESCHVFEIALDGIDEPAQLALNDVKSRAFDVGQRVRITYTLRGIPPIWQRAYVSDMNPEP